MTQENVGIVCLILGFPQATKAVVDLYDRFIAEKAAGMSPVESLRRMWKAMPIVFLICGLACMGFGAWLVWHPQKNSALDKTSPPPTTAVRSTPPEIEDKPQAELPKRESAPQKQSRRTQAQPKDDRSQTATPSNGQSPPQSQTCVGSNCIQGGNNYGSMQLNQYGAPKLVLSDQQMTAVVAAMRPYADMKTDIFCHNCDADTQLFADRLAKAFHSAGINFPEEAHSGFVTLSLPAGVSVWCPKDRQGAAEALAKALVSSGVIQPPMRVNWLPEGAEFKVWITPNR